MNTIKKLISCAVIISQIGCANHVIHSSLSNTGFDPNYNYKIHTNQNVDFDAPGIAIQNQPDRILLTQNGQTKYLLHNQILSIDGSSYREEGNFGGEGASIGGTITGLFSGIMTLVAINSDSESCTSDCATANIMGFLLGGGIGAVLGSVIGYGIGATIPKHSEIQITPTFTSSSNNVGAGANVSVRF